MSRSAERGAPRSGDELEKVQLTRRFILWQRARGHRSATDDILCAFAGHQAQPHATAILDLGAGQGSVALMFAGVNPHATITAVEAQEVSYNLLVRNTGENGLAARVTPVHGDLREVDFGKRRFDLVVGSPPFVPLGRGLLPRDQQRAAARFELRGGIEDYCAAAARWLTEDGRAVFLMDGAQDARSRQAAAHAGLHVRARLIVYPQPGVRPRFIVYQLAAASVAEGVRDSSLTIRDETGAWTTEYAAVRRALDLPGAYL